MNMKSIEIEINKGMEKVKDMTDKPHWDRIYISDERDIQTAVHMLKALGLSKMSIIRLFDIIVLKGKPVFLIEIDDSTDEITTYTPHD